MLEHHEEVVEDWYFHHQDQRLENFLCQNHVLKTSERGKRLLFLILRHTKKASQMCSHVGVCLSLPLSECMKEVWKRDMGAKRRAESDSAEEEEGKKHDAGEL